MSSLNDLDKLVGLLIQAQELSERAGNQQVKLLIEIAMFELGKSIAQQSLSDFSTKTAKSN